MDPAGLAVGVVPLIVLLFDKYGRLANLRNQYKDLDKDLNKCLKTIHADQCLFKSAINALLRSCRLPDADREEMMANLHSDRWSEAFLSSQLHDKLGDVLPAVCDMIESAEDTILQIEAELSKLYPMNTTNTKYGSTDPAEVSDGFLKWFPSFPLRRVRRGKKFKCLLNNTIQQLKTLQSDLRESGKRIESVIFLRNQAPPHSLDNAIALYGGTVSYSEDRLNAVARQKASRKLHSIVSRYLPLSCQCHLLHICLDDLESLITEPVGSQRTEAPRFYFLLSTISDRACLRGLPATQTRIPYFTFTATNEGISAGSLPQEPECFYKNMEASDEPFEHLFGDPSNGGNGGTTFILRSLALKGEYMAIQKAAISLDKLISSGLTRLECFQIAKRLVENALFFYASPWISGWTLETVECFGKTASDRQEFLGTHIAVTFGDAQTTNGDNREILALARMLLRLGLKKNLQNLSEGDSQDLSKDALYDLCREMGNDFKKVVEDLIAWGTSNVDLMERDNLVGFLSDIDVLKKLIEGFTPK